MESSVFPPQEEQKIKLSDIPLKWGIITGVIGCILITLNFTVIIKNYMAFLAFSFIIFVVTVILYGVAGAKQRKALGGYITLKQAFQAIFFVILISTIISTIYGIIYTKYIDPDVYVKVKEGTLAFMEKMKTPQDKIDKALEDFDKQKADGMKPANLLLSFAKSLVLYSIFGFICALIVKRKRPRTID